MENTETEGLIENKDFSGIPESVETHWGNDAPRGGKAVLNRILRDGAKVPLFFGQTLINSLRDVGYNNTTSALCEHVDNAIQADAKQVRIYFHQSEKKGPISVLVLDNGKGMSQNVLKVATSFGGSTVFGSRKQIGRFGMGMKTAALSMCPAFDIYSWQEREAFYSMSIDIEDIGNNRSNLIELPDPELSIRLPREITDILLRPAAFPKDPNNSQRLLTSSVEGLSEALGTSGTLLFMPNCDRLTYQRVQTLVDHATKEMGRIFRRFIDSGLRIFINNRLVEAFDPTYSMESARHMRIAELDPKKSRLLSSQTIEVPISPGSETKTKVRVRLFILPYEQWTKLGRATLKNKLHLFDDYAVSILRNNREVAIGYFPKLKVRKHHYFNWIGLEIDFWGEADEGFGIASNKQGVRIKEYVYERIVEEMGEEIKNAREMVRKFHAESAARKKGAPNEAEQRATEAEAFQGHSLPELSESDLESLDSNLRTLAIVVKRDDESDEEAFERLKRSSYAIIFKHDEYWPFYHCDFKFGKVITTINTAHPFFTHVWQPLSELAKYSGSSSEGGDDDDTEVAAVGHSAAAVLTAIQAMLLSLARTQSQLTTSEKDSHFAQLFETLRREWSSNLATQLNVAHA